MERLSKRVQNLGYSKTFVVSNKVREMKANGVDVISLTLGEPDFDVPQNIKASAEKAIEENYSHYSPVAGFLELREAVCHKLKRDNDLDFKPNQICVSNGAKQSITNVFLAILNDGDEVIVPKPYWVSYEEMVKMAGGKPVFVETDLEHHYKMTPDQLKDAITPKTKAILYSSPCNPSGSFYTKEELEGLAKVIEQYPQITVISDEIYEYINYEGKHASIASFSAIKDQVVVINGMSKGFAMTGWRLGYSASPEWLAKSVEKIQGQVTSGANTIAQRAAITALNTDYSEYQYMVKEFKKRRDLIFNLIQEIPHFKMEKPQAAFYAFPDISYYIGKKLGDTRIEDADDFALFLLEKAFVGCVGGDSFGAPNCIRFSYATSESQIIEAMTRIKHLLAEFA
ncbi:MAG: aspartate aminotransferase [Flavobacteriales bacterium]|nr:MAG: aspartate aminotransferase [Flavobacteriales bacterium]